MASTVLINNVEWETNKVRYIVCKSWQDFTIGIRKVHWLTTDDGYSGVGHAIYRGHASTGWKLSSTLERKFDQSGGTIEHRDSQSGMNPKNYYKGLYENASKNILEKFKMFAKEGAYGMNLPESDDEFWALGRHYELLTPLLDWTESPYIAAFFAFMELYKSLEFKIPTEQTSLSEGGKVHVWGLRRWPGLERENEFEIVSLPRIYGSRAWAQSGLFTRLTSSAHLDIQSYLESRQLAHYLECYGLPFDCAATALLDLKSMNIRYSKLFPDLTGAAQEANVSDVYLVAYQMQSQVLWDVEQ